MNIVKVILNNGQTIFCRNSFDKLKCNFNVIINTDRGFQYGKVIKFINDIEKFDDVSLSEIFRISTKKDYYQDINNKKLEKEALEKCRELVKENNYSMNILDCDFNFDRTQLLFRFVADERIDFRQLARDLGSIYRTRIELRQIGIRDKAKEIGGIGPCGRLLCCNSFFSSFDSISISMAKNQNVSLSPSKINGACGRLLCCLKYENDVYTECRKKLPKVGSKIEYDGKEGKVISVDVLNHKYKLEFKDKTNLEVDCDDSEK